MQRYQTMKYDLIIRPVVIHGVHKNKHTSDSLKDIHLFRLIGYKKFIIIFAFDMDQ